MAHNISNNFYTPWKSLINDFISHYIYFSVHPCDNGDNGGCDHTCTKDGDEAVCSCKENHLLQPDGKTCKISKFYT